MWQYEEVQRYRQYKNLYQKCIILAVITVLILFGTYNRIFSLAAFFICLAILVFDENQFSLMMMIYVLMLAGIFKISYDGMSYFTFLVLVYVVMAIFRQQEFPWTIFIFALYMLCVQCVTHTISIEKDIKLIGNFFFLYFAFLESEEYDENILYITYILSVIVSSILRFFDSNVFRITLYVGSLKNSGISGSGTDIIRFSGLFFDPNYYAINVIIALILVVLLYYSGKIRIAGAVCLSFPLLYFALLTNSKSALLMVIIPVILFILANRKKEKYWIQFFCMTIIGIVVVLLLTGKLHFLDTILYRFSKGEGSIDSLTTGRTHVWRRYLKFITSNISVLFWGTGIGADIYGEKGTHNTYIEILYHLGIFGGILLVVALQSIYKIRAYFGKKNFFNYSILTCILVMYTFLGMLGNFEWPIHFLFAFMVCQTDWTKKYGVI